MASLLLGFDIGGTKSAACLGQDDGQLIDRIQQDTTGPVPTLEGLIQSAQALCQKHQATPLAVGISCGSPLDRTRGLIQEPANLPGWVDVPVVDRIQKHFDLPTNLENDADASALAEWRWGLNKSLDDVIYMTCGTGQGSGLILGGRLHRGRDTLAGEIGHVRLEKDGPVGCRKAGSVEGFTSGPALAYHARRRLSHPHDPSSLDGLEVDNLTGRDVGEAATAGDVLAQQSVRDLGEQLGRACAILIDVLNPQRISLGSLAIRMGDLLLKPVQQAVDAEAHGPSAKRCQIAPAVLGHRVQDLAALAAATLAHQTSS